MAKVTINGKIHTVDAGACLGDLLASHHAIEMPCAGYGRCGKCRVRATGSLSPLSDAEKLHLTEQEIADGVRLACCTAVEGDCVVTTAENARHVIRTDGITRPVALNPMFAKYGVAVDIGTTTLAASLYGADGAQLAVFGGPNPQSRWGADVISRIESALGGAGDEMAETTVRIVGEMVRDLAEQAGISAVDIDGLVITGNTVMLHLLTNTSTEPLSHAPFAAERLFGENLSAETLGLRSVLPSAKIYLPPCVAAFIGGDITTALLASDICEMDGTHLLVDIGTNGEMVLKHDGQLYVCSTAAGPAFEGAGISMGMGGKAGAIDHVSVEDGELVAHVIGEGAPVGLCGSGVVDAVAALLETGAMDETGYLEDDPAVIEAPVTFTQQDVRAVQLAKSAIHAGIRTLLHSAGLTPKDVTCLHIAGGFGSFLDVRSAGKIGLLPEETVGKVRVIGNAALSGAAMLLLSKDLRETCEAFAQNAQIIELSAHPVFAEEYIERMMF